MSVICSNWQPNKSQDQSLSGAFEEEDEDQDLYWIDGGDICIIIAAKVQQI